MKKTSKRTRGSRKPSRKRPARQRSPKRPARSARKPPHELVLVAFADLARRLELRWYVFGAQAVGMHGFPRATDDVDITVELGTLPVRDFVGKLVRAGFTARFPDEAFIAATRVIPVVHEASRLPIDFVLAGPGLEKQFLDEVEQHEIGTVQIPVLSLENLIVTKLLAGRPKDLEDVRELIDRPTLDHDRVDKVLAELEAALDQDDLRPLYRRLRKQT